MSKPTLTGAALAEALAGLLGVDVARIERHLTAESVRYTGDVEVFLHLHSTHEDPRRYQIEATAWGTGSRTWGYGPTPRPRPCRRPRPAGVRRGARPGRAGRGLARGAAGEDGARPRT